MSFLIFDPICPELQTCNDPSLVKSLQVKVEFHIVFVVEASLHSTTKFIFISRYGNDCYLCRHHLNTRTKESEIRHICCSFPRRRFTS